MNTPDQQPLWGRDEFWLGVAAGLFAFAALLVGMDAWETIDDASNEWWNRP